MVPILGFSRVGSLVLWLTFSIGQNMADNGPYETKQEGNILEYDPIPEKQLSAYLKPNSQRNIS